MVKYFSTLEDKFQLIKGPFNIFYLSLRSYFNPFNPNQLSTLNFSLHNIYKIRHLVMRKWELMNQSKLLKIKSKILSSLFNEKYMLKFGEFNNTTGTERVKKEINYTELIQ